ncbi:MAG TPA: hypothetical protein DDX11_02860 [Candidatus Peribacter riflensis]|uniref:Uncharacterized protein n=1 Tax=Candidatus Peribacter riflensis TaxID=1735162 RepID=A0A0S1SIU7_9BACT|nr:MAG: Uncharacterized protein PeribacterA2_0736 [Candidatus Peribacter riflensis]OGJ77789.1 MAG: hypothetical protein A2398_00770 [Candidatus Peribacteria bacterium RIFOXYB1_FULL_57_12]ALM11203.1 MAG: Uncharacterized protein PeribacterB2_0737 [Candidatus Peribacter riflensis]ALM12306.1 MAG: Uncharacterized protein PeribacterC2_0737 [Candidatus Peribacter riflensis]ALM13408.1 MAG: Uncharacterized protein PeribacterD1_0737 [Candidatus Peribacter riflensis]
MQKACRECGQFFEITQDDLDFYEKISPAFNGKKELIPPPLLCPDCRRQRRFAFRNERSLYRRRSSLSGAEIISCYPEEYEPPVYGHEEWFEDKWDALAYGHPWDAYAPFLTQFHTLLERVPAIASNSHVNNVNCPYTNYVGSCKNCYMIFGSVYCEDCLYGTPYNSRSCVDSLLVRDCELCHDCVTCEKCYSCISCQDCANGHDLLFCYDCDGCRDCVGCAGLRRRQYCIFNEQLSPEEYRRKRSAIDLCEPKSIAEIREKFEETKRKKLRRSTLTLSSENVTGDYVYFSRNTHDAYDVQRCEDCAYMAQTIDMKDCQDCNYMEECELCHEYICSYRNHSIHYCIWLLDCSDVWYSSYCTSSHHLFGCIGLKHKQYCILNKQYSKEEYETLVPQIIESMRKTGEWGEFFPAAMSPFAYNETVAQEYFPMTKKEVEKRGWKWREEKDDMPKVSKVIPATKLPDAIEEIPDDIVNWAIECEATKRPFRIIRQELDFYRKMKLPIPHFHPDERHRRRMALRNPRRLWKRPCRKCGKEMETTYSPERPEIVYCEECYLKEVY